MYRSLQYVTFTSCNVVVLRHIILYCKVGCTVKKGIVTMIDSLLFQIQMSEHNSLLHVCGGELHDNLFFILSQLSSTLSYRLGN